MYQEDDQKKNLEDSLHYNLKEKSNYTNPKKVYAFFSLLFNVESGLESEQI